MGSGYYGTYVRCKVTKMLKNMDKIVKMAFAKMPFFMLFLETKYD